MFRHLVFPSGVETELDFDSLTGDIAALTELCLQGLEVCFVRAEKADARYTLLSLRCKRPTRCGATERRDKCAPSHTIVP